ncbi:Uncharacterised protein [Mycobacterium tuberculosis]|nr:Uncharacterised protein [Mycobacterium tuberculosis]
MRIYRVFERDPPAGIFVGFDVVLAAPVIQVRHVIALDEESGNTQHDAGQTVVAMCQLAEVLGASFGHAVDVLGNGRDGFVDPRRGLVCRRCQGVAENGRR